MSADSTQQNTVERFLIQPAGSWLERLVGTVSLLFGAALFAASCFFTYALLTKPVGNSKAVYIVVLVLVFSSAFLLNAGVRLLFAVPNKVGGLVPPAVWFLVSAAMLCLAGFVAFTFTAARFNDAAQALASALLLALLSYGAGMHFRRKGQARSAA